MSEVGVGIKTLTKEFFYTGESGIIEKLTLNCGGSQLLVLLLF